MGRALSLLLAVALCVALLSVGVSQQTPIGSLTGRVTMAENGRPLPFSLVSIERIGAEDELRIPNYDTADANGIYEFTRLPVGAYRLSVSTKAHRLKPRIVLVDEGMTKSYDLDPAPNPPNLELYASKRVFTPEETPDAELHGFLPEDEVQVRVFRLDPEAVVRQGGLTEALGPWLRSEIEKPIDPALSKPVEDYVHKIAKKDAEGVFVEPLKLPKMAEGIYWVRCVSQTQHADVVLSVSRIGLVTKVAGGMVLAYVTDLARGVPVSGAVIVRNSGDRVVSAGKTDADGLLEFDLPRASSRASVMATHGDSVAICDFWADSGSGQGSTRIFVYNERPVYRAGDVVRFKGIVRRLQGVDYRLPGTGTAKVKVFDLQNNVLEEMSLPISRHGTFHGSFSTSTETAPGYYQAQIEAFGGRETDYFTISAYRKPEFTVSVKGDKPWFIFGNRGSATVDCQYYFGGPVVGAKVKATVYRSPRWSSAVGEEESEYEEYDGGYAGGEYSQELEVVTDANGKAVIEFDTRTDGDPADPVTDYNYSVFASVSEPGEKYASGEAGIPVVRADFALGVSTDVYVASVGEAVPVTVAAGTHGSPSQPVSGQTIEVTVGRETWQNGELEFTPIATRTVRTGADGKAGFDFTVTRAESLAIRARARDSQGHETQSEAHVYVEGDRSRSPRAGKLSVTLDRETYAEGQTAKAVVQCSAPGGHALLTVEADRVMMKRVVPLSAEATTVEFPIERAFLPNAFVSVAYVRDGTFLEAGKPLLVDLGERKLNVEVASDRPAAQPGETVNLTVRTTEPDGRPVPAEVSVGVVDEAVYAIAEDGTNPLQALYPKRYNAVSTYHSFAKIYLDGGDKSPMDIAVRKRFLDTAFWQPAIQTDRRGTARVSVKLPDNITAWRATAVGVTDSTAVGIGKALFKARKDLMVRLELPTFLVQGDTRRIAAIVNNDTGRDAEVSVLLEAKGVEVGGARSQKILVPAGKPQSVFWNLSTPASGEAVLTAKAWIPDGPNDGVELRIPISPHGRLVRTAVSGRATGRAAFTLDRKSSTDPNSGGMTLTVSPGLLSVSEESLASLVGFPYGCVEQTMSRFLPSILVQKLIRRPDLAAQVPQIAADGITRLANMQNADGGWGWWQNGGPDAFMTAYVLDGLRLARDAGYPSDRIDIRTALEAARKRLATPAKGDLPRDLAYLAFALIEHGDTNVAAKYLANLDPDRADASTLAYMALGFEHLGDAYATQARATAEILASRAQAGPSGSALWVNGDEQWGSEGTAVALRALTILRPDDPIVPRAILHLVSSRQGESWTSTRDTAAVLIALAAYLEKYPENAKPTTVTVLLNGRTLQSRRFDPDEADGLKIDLSARELKSGANRVEIRTTDGATVFYGAEMRQYEASPAMAAQESSAGVRVRRHYRLLAPRRNKWGELRLLPGGSPVESVESGTIIQCELTVNAASPLAFAMIEDPIPSNCRVVEREGLGEGEAWSWWWSNLAIRDDRVAFFADQLPKGESKFTYHLQAESPGVAAALPTLVQNMYDPTTAAWSAETRMEVRP
ncbi:MAG TPA: alpha-2-macroglobulin family protein [Fimbriimonas sp.]